MKKKLNKKGVAYSVESAGMLLVVGLILLLVVQITAWSTMQISVKSAAYEAARGGAKVGASKATQKAITIAKDYGQDTFTKWNPDIHVQNNGQFLTVKVSYKINPFGLFKGVTVSASSKEVIEEIA